LDNERIACVKVSKKDVILIIANPFSGELREVPLGIKDYYFDPYDQTIPWLPQTDPSLTRVVYPKVGNYGRFGLWDVQNGQDLWVLDGYNFNESVEWSPNGDLLSLRVYKRDYNEPQNLELFMINPEGQVQQWANLAKFQGSSGVIKWSPDGRYLVIADSYHANLSSSDALLVLDTQTRQITDYCDVFPRSRPEGVPHGTWWCNMNAITKPTHPKDFSPAIGFIE
jgi:WD40 repeat protein